ncbi:MAG: cell envelope integrity protein CreD [Acidobacteriota bacterium]|nr:cell envelope integrity protein CreD [Acidobacteriota bacterium]
MNQGPIQLPNLQLWNRSRSMGLKLLVVSGLALLMTIPALFVNSIVEERTKRAKDVVQEISARVGGQQTFLGPTISIPYAIPPLFNGASPERGIYVVFPVQGDASAKLRTQERRRSLFKVPVFQADLNFDAAFDLTGVPSSAPTGAVLDWDHAAIVVGVSDARGALADGTLTINAKTVTFVPAEVVSSNNEAGLPLTYFGVREIDVVKANAKFRVAATLRFSGAQRISILAYGKTTHLNVEGDWPSPSFDGGFLPSKRTIAPQGFNAEWTVPFIARGIRAEGTSTAVSTLDHTALGVSFIEVADPYQSVNRSLKYVLLFLGLLFLSYFVFEVTTRKRVHPAQYVLVGVAQMIFYLLLLSLSERIGFDWGFLIAGGATVLLLSANASWIFESKVQGVRALVVFGLLYSLIYLMLRLEDNALLVGAVASFLAVAAVMYFTRNIDWYRSISPSSSQPPSV